MLGGPAAGKAESDFAGCSSVWGSATGRMKLATKNTVKQNIHTF